MGVVRAHRPDWLVKRAASITGHSLRVTGARYLTRLGLDVLSVQLLGRWGSNVIAQYIGEVPIEELANKLRRAQGQQPSELLHDRLATLGSPTEGDGQGLFINVLSGLTHRLVPGLDICWCGWDYKRANWGVAATSAHAVTCTRCAKYGGESDEE